MDGGGQKESLFTLQRIGTAAQHSRNLKESLRLQKSVAGNLFGPVTEHAVGILTLSRKQRYRKPIPCRPSYKRCSGCVQGRCIPRKFSSICGTCRFFRTVLTPWLVVAWQVIKPQKPGKMEKQQYNIYIQNRYLCSQTFKGMKLSSSSFWD